MGRKESFYERAYFPRSSSITSGKLPLPVRMPPSGSDLDVCKPASARLFLQDTIMYPHGRASSFIEYLTLFFQPEVEVSRCKDWSQTLGGTFYRFPKFPEYIPKRAYEHRLSTMFVSWANGLLQIFKSRISQMLKITRNCEA